MKRNGNAERRRREISRRRRRRRGMGSGEWVVPPPRKYFNFSAPHFTLVKEALIEIGCVVTSLVVGWLSRACTVAKRCILGQ